jgi:hypothetical protein
MDMLFPDVSDRGPRDPNPYKIIDIDMKDKEFQYTLTNVEQVTTLLRSLCHSHPTHLSVVNTKKDKQWSHSDSQDDSDHKQLTFPTTQVHSWEEGIIAHIPLNGTYQIQKESLSIYQWKDAAPMARNDSNGPHTDRHRKPWHDSDAPGWILYGTLTTTRRLKAWLLLELLKTYPKDSILQIFEQHAPSDATLLDGSGPPTLPPLDQR